MRRTRLERHVEGRAARRVPGLPQSLDFGMRMPRSPVPAPGNDASAGNNDGANGRIGMCAADALPRLENCLAHKLLVNRHWHARLDIIRAAFNGKLELRAHRVNSRARGRFDIPAAGAAFS